MMNYDCTWLMKVYVGLLSIWPACCQGWSTGSSYLHMKDYLNHSICSIPASLTAEALSSVGGVRSVSIKVLLEVRDNGDLIVPSSVHLKVCVWFNVLNFLFVWIRCIWESICQSLLHGILHFHAKRISQTNPPK